MFHVVIDDSHLSVVFASSVYTCLYLSFPHLLLVSLYVVGQSHTQLVERVMFVDHNDLRNAYPIVYGTNPKARSIRAILMCVFQI